MPSVAVKAQRSSIRYGMQILDAGALRMHQEGVRVVFGVVFGRTEVPGGASRRFVSQLYAFLTFGHQAAMQSIRRCVGGGSIRIADHPVIERRHLARGVCTIGIGCRALPCQPWRNLAGQSHSRQIQTDEMSTAELEIGGSPSILGHQLPPAPLEES